MPILSRLKLNCDWETEYLFYLLNAYSIYIYSFSVYIVCMCGVGNTEQGQTNNHMSCVNEKIDCSFTGSVIPTPTC